MVGQLVKQPRAPLLAQSYPLRAAVASGIGFVGSCVLALLMNAILGSGPEADAPLTGPFATGFLGIFVIGGGVLGFFVGRATNCAFPCAVGMVLPLPIAMGIEMGRDATSHNLFPFEIIFMWFPALVVPYIAALVGSFKAPQDSV